VKLLEAEKVELVVEPDAKLTQKRSKAASIGSRSTAAKTLVDELNEREFDQDKQELQLDVSDSATRSKAVVSTFASSERPFSVKGARNGGEMLLMLDSKDEATRSRTPSAGFSRSSNDRFVEPREDSTTLILNSKEIEPRKSRPNKRNVPPRASDVSPISSRYGDELQLEPQDESVRQRVSGASKFAAADSRPSINSELDLINNSIGISKELLVSVVDSNNLERKAIKSKGSKFSETEKDENLLGMQSVERELGLSGPVVNNNTKESTLEASTMNTTKKPMNSNRVSFAADVVDPPPTQRSSKNKNTPKATANATNTPNIPSKKATPVAADKIKSKQSSISSTPLKSAKSTRFNVPQPSEPTPPYLQAPAVGGKAPDRSFKDGFTDDLTADEMMALVDAKMKALDL